MKLEFGRTYDLQSRDVVGLHCQLLQIADVAITDESGEYGSNT